MGTEVRHIPILHLELLQASMQGIVMLDLLIVPCILAVHQVYLLLYGAMAY